MRAALSSSGTPTLTSPVPLILPLVPLLWQCDIRFSLSLSLVPCYGNVTSGFFSLSHTHSSFLFLPSPLFGRRMGTLVGHIAPSVVLVAVGLWHLLSVFTNFVKAPREYAARAWHPATWLPPRGKHIELYLLVVFIPVAVFYELGISTNFQAIVGGVIPKNRVSSFEHSTTLIMFWIYAVVVLLSETTTALPFPSDAPFLFASMAFGLECLSVTHEAARNQGLESQCNLLLAYIAGLCAVSSGLLALRPKLFLVDVVLCMGIILQGTWLFQIGLYLYVEDYIPEGCHYRLDLPTGIDGSTVCDVEVSRIRAVALMNLAFNFHVIMVVCFSVLVFALVAKVFGIRRVGSAYDPISRDPDADSVQMKPLQP